MKNNYDKFREKQNLDLVDIINSATKGPFGPKDSNNLDHLLNKDVLFANEKAGLGYYGVLLQIDHDLEFPYLVSISSTKSRKARAKWIVAYK